MCCFFEDLLIYWFQGEEQRGRGDERGEGQRDRERVKKEDSPPSTEPGVKAQHGGSTWGSVS